MQSLLVGRVVGVPVRHASGHRCRCSSLGSGLMCEPERLCFPNSAPWQVPVGGAVIASPSTALVDAVSQMYPGRASIGPALDVFVTLLELVRCRGSGGRCCFSAPVPPSAAPSPTPRTRACPFHLPPWVQYLNECLWLFAVLVVGLCWACV
jgi:hypothetical protein